MLHFGILRVHIDKSIYLHERKYCHKNYYHFRLFIWQRRFYYFGYPLVPIIVCTHFKFFAKPNLQNPTVHTKIFKNKSAKFNRHIYFFLSNFATNFCKRSKILYASKKEKSPKILLIIPENFFGLYYSCEKSCLYKREYNICWKK